VTVRHHRIYFLSTSLSRTLLPDLWWPWPIASLRLAPSLSSGGQGPTHVVRHLSQM